MATKIISANIDAYDRQTLAALWGKPYGSEAALKEDLAALYRENEECPFEGSFEIIDIDNFCSMVNDEAFDDLHHWVVPIETL